MNLPDFSDIVHKIIRFTLLIILTLGALGFIAFTVKHLLDFIMLLWGIPHVR
jgi:hypothetical protein